VVKNLKAEGAELLVTLEKAAVEMQIINDTPIIIDGINYN
jgi:hypothetical protein